MAQQKIEFGKGSWPALDESTTDGAIPASAIDAFQDEQGVWFKRPGHVAWSSSVTVDTPVQGIFWSIGIKTFIAVGGGNLYSIDPSTGIVTAITGDTIDPDLPAKFAENGTVVYVTSGSTMVTTDGSVATTVGDVIAPINSTHLVWLDAHILANESGTERFWWTDAGSSTWGAANYGSASANLDHLIAMVVLGRELYLLGTHSTEVWYNTGQTPGTFLRQEGAFYERGCSAPYSVVKADNTLFWLDHERNFIRLDGRSPKVVSGPVTRILRELPDVTDLQCSQFQYLNNHFILLSSSKSSFSMIYDYVLDAWYQWGVWNSQTFSYDEWPIFQVIFSPEFNHYVALGFDGIVYTITGDASDARFLLRSSHLSFGTYKWKTFAQLLVRAKRGYVLGTSDPVFIVRWRDQNEHWSNGHSIPLNKSGQYKNVEHVHRLGRARTRQFEFIQTDQCPFAFVGAEIEFESLSD